MTAAKTRETGVTWFMRSLLFIYIKYVGVF